MDKQRDLSIDLIKFIAVLLIINSHADICYPRYSFLATGGAIGDALFLFCSGYTLFWGQLTRFDNWYKKRVSRIYPSVFASLILMCVLGFENVGGISLTAALGGEFIIAIMCYYILLYLCQRYFRNNLSLVLFADVIVTIVAYMSFPYKYETGENGIYGISTLFRWIPYFAMMLIGAWIGLKRKNGTLSVRAGVPDTILLLMCVGVFYGIQMLAKYNPSVGPWQIITLPFLAGIVYYMWKCSHSAIFRRIYSNRVCNRIILIAGGLCLESYLVQFYIFTDRLNHLFPLNIFIIIIAVLILAYVCRCLARLLLQTFRTEPYDWAKIISLC